MQKIFNRPLEASETAPIGRASPAALGWAGHARCSCAAPRSRGQVDEYVEENSDNPGCADDTVIGVGASLRILLPRRSRKKWQRRLRAAPAPAVTAPAEARSGAEIDGRFACRATRRCALTMKIASACRRPRKSTFRNSSAKTANMPNGSTTRSCCRSSRSSRFSYSVCCSG